MSYIEPTLSQLTTILRRYSQDTADRSLACLRERVGEHLDPSNPLDCRELLRWLNKWLCRLRYAQPNDDGPDVFFDSLTQWWHAHGRGLPNIPVSDIDDQTVDTLTEAYADLECRPGARRTQAGSTIGYRRIGPTAASKIMFVLRPQTVPAWDARIAERTVGGTTKDHYARHLKAAQRWAQAILAEAHRNDIPDIPAHVQRPYSTLAKLRDEWMYLTITRQKPVPQP
jgi:hypothetical protein